MTAILMIAAAAALSGEPDPVRPQVDALGWLAGEWEEVTQSGPHVVAWTVEHWSRPHGGVMLGTGMSGRRVTGAVTNDVSDLARSFEYMRIARDGSGAITFYGSPGGAPAVAFPMARMGRYKVVFENAANAYPQRIAYRWDGNILGETLVATISMIDGSRQVSWTYRRPATPRP